MQFLTVFNANVVTALHCTDRRRDRGKEEGRRDKKYFITV